MFKNLLIILSVLIFSIFASAQNKSVYSELTPKNCKDAGTDKSIPGSFFGKCKGVGGYDLEYYLDDERNSLGVVFPSKKVVALNFWNYFREFSELGEKAEWRMKGTKPVALIVRLTTSEENGTKKTSYLLVSKIADENACVTDVVKPGKNQNATARQLADRASTKECMAGFADSNSDDVSDEPQAVLHDEFPLTNREDLMARFDNFSVELQNKPDAKGYIVINGKKIARSKAEKQIKDYVKMRLFDSSRLVYIDKESDKATVIEFWIVPPGTYVPER